MKLTDLAPEQKRIAIAEACGWTAKQDSNGYWRAVDDKGNDATELWLSERNVWNQGIPDYLNDLNAMASAEFANEMPYSIEYVWWLGRIACEARGMNPDKQSDSDLNVMAVFTTAAQRADAFLLATGRATV